MNIYLDIDGVLLANDLTPAAYANEFLRFVLERFPTSTYWLTTHCQGDASVPVRHIGHLFEEDVQELMLRIQATSWDVAKTEAINFEKPFLWFDDDLFFEERRALLVHDALDNWIGVDLRANPLQLKDFLISFPLPKQ